MPRTATIEYRTALLTVMAESSGPIPIMMLNNSQVGLADKVRAHETKQRGSSSFPTSSSASSRYLRGGPIRIFVNN